jgi:alpha-ketoglutarate-dependent taurine dioxygenase
LREQPDAETVRAIYQAWLDHLVLIFPEQQLSQEDLIRATGFFGQIGKLSRPPNFFRRAIPDSCPGS